MNRTFVLGALVAMTALAGCPREETVDVPMSAAPAVVPASALPPAPPPPGGAVPAPVPAAIDGAAAGAPGAAGANGAPGGAGGAGGAAAPAGGGW